MVLDQLGLHGKASTHLSSLHTVAHVAEHQVRGTRHLMYRKLVEQYPGARLRYGVSEGASIDSIPRDNACVSRILREELIVSKLHV